MGFETYSDLKDEIKSFLWDRADVVAKIPTFISLAEAEMRRLLKTRQMHRKGRFSVSSETTGLPCEAQEILTCQLNIPGGGTIEIPYTTPEAMASISTQAKAQPRFFTLLEDKLHFIPTPDRTYTGHLTLREGFCSLSDSNRCNWILQKHPDVYLCGALKWGKRWLIDQDVDWNTPFLEGIEAANRNEPVVQGNSRLRTDALAIMGSYRRYGAYNIYTDGYGPGAPQGNTFGSGFLNADFLELYDDART